MALIRPSGGSSPGSESRGGRRSESRWPAKSKGSAPAEIWRPLPERRWERREYTYDLVDRPRGRRRAFHLHDRDLAEMALRTVVHEHCEENIGQPTCLHYLGRELPDGYQAIDLLVAAWVKPGDLGCASLTCLD